MTTWDFRVTLFQITDSETLKSVVSKAEATTFHVDDNEEPNARMMILAISGCSARNLAVTCSSLRPLWRGSSYLTGRKVVKVLGRNYDNYSNKILYPWSLGTEDDQPVQFGHPLDALPRVKDIFHQVSFGGTNRCRLQSLVSPKQRLAVGSIISDTLCHVDEPD